MGIFSSDEDDWVMANQEIEIEKLKKENKELKQFCVELENQKKEQHLQWQQRCTENHNEDSREIDELQKENKRLDSLLGKLNEELLKIVEPRMLSDFTGYNEETNSFDIVLAVKEIIEELEHEVERLEDKCCECERE